MTSVEIALKTYEGIRDDLTAAEKKVKKMKKWLDKTGDDRAGAKLAEAQAKIEELTPLKEPAFRAFRQLKEAEEAREAEEMKARIAADNAEFARTNPEAYARMKQAEADPFDEKEYKRERREAAYNGGHVVSKY